MPQRSGRESTARSRDEQDPAPASPPNKWQGWQPRSSALIRMNRIPAGIQFARLTDPLAVYFGEFPFEVTTFQAYNLENFVSTPFSPHEENTGSRHPEESRHKIHSCPIRLTFQRGRIQTQHQLAFAITGEFISLRIRNHTNLQFGGLGHGRSPNNAVPIRTIVAPSSIAISKS